MIAVKIALRNKQTRINKTLSKLSIVTLLSKNQNSDELVFKSRQYLDNVDNLSSKKIINLTQKQTKIFKSLHKLHSLHRSHNKA